MFPSIILGTNFKTKISKVRVKPENEVRALNTQLGTNGGMKSFAPFIAPQGTLHLFFLISYSRQFGLFLKIISL